MTFGSVFGRTFSPTFQPSSQAAAAGGGWWDLNGTITSCVAAYQPKGAASYAASLTDLSGNEHTITSGTNPTWDSTSGWKFNRADKQYLITDITPNALTWTYIIRFSNHKPSEFCAFFGAYTNTTTGTIYYSFVSGKWRAFNGTDAVVDGALPASGVHAISNKTVYWDGASIRTFSAGGYPANTVLHIGKFNGVSDDYTITAYIQAMAIYNAALTSTQVGDLTTAMNAL